MHMDISLLRAENIKNSEVLTRSILIPSQMSASNSMLEYILDPELGGYGYHLSGKRGNGKTYTTLSTAYIAKKLNPYLKITFLTYDSEGNSNYHPLFDQNISDSDVRIFNDVHNYLGAIRDGKVNKDRAIRELTNLFGLVKDRKAKSIVITDTPLWVYANDIGDEQLGRILLDSYFLTENELVTGNYADLSRISQIYNLNADPRLLWSIHHTKPNIRYLLSIGHLYNDAVVDIKELIAILKQEKFYRSVEGQEKACLDTMLDMPEIKYHDDVLELIEKLEQIEAAPSESTINNAVLELQKYKIEKMDGFKILPGYTPVDVISSQNIASRAPVYVPTALGNFKDIWEISGRTDLNRMSLTESERFAKLQKLADDIKPGDKFIFENLGRKLADNWEEFEKLKTRRRLKKYWAVRKQEFSYFEYYVSRNFDEKLKHSHLREAREDVHFSFVIGQPIADMISYRIAEEGIQTT